MILRALALSMLIAMPARADCTGVIVPPPQYDHAPTRPFIDYRTHFWDINSACRKFGDFSYEPFGYRLWGCIVPGKIDGVPLRIVPDDQDAEFTACLIRHENAHLNGWPANHPGGSYE